MENVKYKVGDKLVITDEIYGHEFEIGDIVTVISINEEDVDYKVYGDNVKDFWYVRNDEVELYNEVEQMSLTQKEIIEMEIENFIIYFCGSEEGLKEQMKETLKTYMGEVYE